MCQILDKFSSSRVGSVKTKLQLGYTPPIAFLSSPTFWELRDQPSFAPFGMVR